MSIVSTLCYIAGFPLLVIATQDIHIFPGAMFSLFERRSREPKSLPRGVVSEFVETPDKKKLEVWRLSASPDAERLPYVAVICHGNAGRLKDFYALQLWMHSFGVTSYGFDYRGFGKSSGWPSERGLQIDTDTVFDWILERENLPPEQLIVIGFSLGGALAARLAAKKKPAVLILLSAFTSLRDVVKDQPLLGLLAPFLRYRLPTRQYVSELDSTDLLVAYGEADRIVPFRHSIELLKAFRGTGKAVVLSSEIASHTNVSFVLEPELNDALRNMLATRPSV